MTAWQELQQTLNELLELDTAHRQQALDTIAVTDPARAAELGRLLNAAEATRWDLQMSGGAAENVIHALGEQLNNAEQLTGKNIGPYHLEKLLGQGGMGAVYLAARADGAYQQLSALKIVPGRTLNSAAGERFVAERQILARLAHPNIARLLDGGVTDQGTPYLVMEYLDGEDMLAYALQHRLNLASRLELFDQLLAAVQFAHSNLIVHGDIKPDNTLVDSEGQLKLLDFGVSQALDRASSDSVHALTPSYSSPERLEGNSLTTGHDIYALGVILYQLLSGRLPYDLTGVEPKLMAATVRSADVPPLRQASMVPQVTKELESICRKAMATDELARYSSTDSFAQDMQRVATHHPITAHPDSWRYRAAKFIRRHRIGVGATALLVIAVGAGTTSSLIQAENARQQAAKAEQVSNFLTSLFSAANPFGAWKEEKSVLDLVRYAETRAAEELGDDPEVLAQVQSLLGEAYLGNGEYAKAVSIAQQVLVTQESLFGERSFEAAHAHNNLAHALIELGSYETARAHARQALQRFEAGGDLWQIDTANALTNLAVAESSLGQRAEAQQLHQRALGIRELLLPANHVSIADSKMSLASVSAALGETDHVVPLNRAAHKIYASHFGDQHPMTVRAMNGVASGEFLSGNHYAAAEAFQKLLDAGSARLGPTHPELALLHNNLGRTLTELGKFEDAATAYQNATLGVSKAPNQRLLSISVRFNQAALDAELGDFPTALEQLSQAGAEFATLLGDGHPLSYRAAVQQAISRALAGDSEVSAELHALIQEHPGAKAQPQWQARARSSLARLLINSGDTVAAATELSHAQPKLDADFMNPGWREHDFLLLQALANADADNIARHATALSKQLPPTSVRRQFAELALNARSRQSATNQATRAGG